MKKCLFKGLMGFVAMGVFVFWGMATVWAGTLDGMSFAGEIGENGQKTGDPEEIVFKDGAFRSKACDRAGFGDAKYTESNSEGVTAFDAETANDKGDKMKWHGEVRDGAIAGSALSLQPGKTEVKEYWFKGELKK